MSSRNLVADLEYTLASLDDCSIQTEYIPDLQPSLLQSGQVFPPNILFADQNVVELIVDKFVNCFDGNLCVLNFASGTRPGGGVRRGAVAQEEDLCRSTNLLFSLESKYAEPFYKANKAEGAPLEFTEGIIYTDGLSVLDCMSEDSCYGHFGVITCPAPNLNRNEGDFTRPVEEVIQERVNRIIYLARSKRITHLVLGAWGCGVFGNDPKMVAEAFNNAIKTYGSGIEEIIFCIWNNPEVMKVFRQIISKPNHRVYLLDSLPVGKAMAQVHHVAEAWANKKFPLHLGTTIIHRATKEQLKEIYGDLKSTKSSFARFKESSLGYAMTAISTYKEFDLPLWGSSRKK